MPTIPLARPTITDDDIRAVQGVLESGSIATESVVKEFEDRFATSIGRKHAIAVNSGTIALYLAVRVQGFAKVVLPAITCPEVLNTVVHAGAEPLIADVEEKMHNLDPRELGGDWTAGADAIVITHAYGHPARIDEIQRTYDAEGLTLIEDFAQSIGATYRGSLCGSFGEISVTSFYATKSLTTGHGGMVLTDSDDLSRQLRIARGDDAYDCLDSFIPLNLKMTDFQAAPVAPALEGTAVMDAAVCWIEFQRALCGGRCHPHLQGRDIALREVQPGMGNCPGCKSRASCQLIHRTNSSW